MLLMAEWKGQLENPLVVLTPEDKKRSNMYQHVEKKIIIILRQYHYYRSLDEIS